MHSHAYTSGSGNEEHYSELSPDADAGSDSTYAASYTKTETQRTVDHSFPSSGNCEYEDNIKTHNLPNEDRIAKYEPTSYEAAGQREYDEHSTLEPKENNHSNESSYNTADGRTDSKYNVNKVQDSQRIIDDADKSSKLENKVDSIDHSSDRGRNKYVQTSYEAAGQNDYGDRSSVQHVEERTFATESHQHEYVPPLPKARDAQTIAERDTIKVKTNRVVEDKSRDNIISHDNGTRNTHFGQEKSTATETERIQKDNVISGIAAGAAAIAATEIAARADSRNQIINNAEIGKQNKPISHGFTPLNEIQDNGDMLTQSESSAMIRAMNRASGADFISHKEIADSYSIANQTDSETAQILKEISFENNGRRNIQSFGFSNPQFGSNAPSGGNKVDAGIIAGRQGNQVTLIVNDKPKQFTIRSGGTVNVGGLVMNVYQMEGNKAFVGWKGATVNDNVLTTSMNTILTVKKGTNTIINGVGLAIDIKDNVKVFSAKVQEAKAVPMFDSVRAVKEKIKAIQEKRAKEISLGNGMSVVMDDDGGRYGLMPISMAPIVTTAGASDADFMQTGDSFTTNDFALKKRGKGINQILRETEFTKH